MTKNNNLKENMIKRLTLAFFAAILLTTAVTGCHTVRGAGEDVEKTGEAIQNATH
jgi:predicted small secreted protein